MGREIRRVPPGWRHPTVGELCGDGGGQPWAAGKPWLPHPQYDENYDQAARRWLENCALWARGEHPDQPADTEFFWDWDGPPPSQEYYRTGRWAFAPEEATWYMMYETTSEGTPISPSFSTPEEVARYCADNRVSAFAGQPASYEDWLYVARGGYAPSGMVLGDGSVVSGVEGMARIAG